MISQNLQLVAPPPRLAESEFEERVVSKPKSRRTAVVEFIRSAKQSLLLSIFRCTI